MTKQQQVSRILAQIDLLGNTARRIKAQRDELGRALDELLIATHDTSAERLLRAQIQAGIVLAKAGVP